MKARRRGIGIGIGKPTLGIILALAAAGTVSVPVVAQQDAGAPRRRVGPGPGGGFGALMRPDYLSRDLAILDEHLRFDDSQRWIVETNLLEYGADFQEKLELVRDQMRGARGEDDPRHQAAARERQRLAREMRVIRREIESLRQRTAVNNPSSEQHRELAQKLDLVRAKLDAQRAEPPDLEQMEALSAIIGAWIPQKEALGAAFLESIQSILDKEQLEHWPAADRALRRQRLLGLGQLSGESVNLFFLVREISATDVDMEPIRLVLEEYAIALDAALVARESQIALTQPDLWKAYYSGDAARAGALGTQEAAARVAVRSVNQKYREAICAASGSPDAAALLRDRYRKAAFPRIYHPTRTQVAFGAVLEMPDLEPAAAASIAALKESYLTELEAQNRALEEITLEQEPTDFAAGAQRRAERPRGAPGGDDDALDQAMAKRGEIEARYLAQLEPMLSPEQRERLPPLRPHGRDGSLGSKARQARRSPDRSDE